MTPKAVHALTREAELLTLCARMSVSDQQQAAIRTLAATSMDWERVVELAKWHGIVPLVYRHLSRHCVDLVPSDVLQGLRQHSQASRLLSCSLTRDLVEIVHACEQAGVTLVPFKGLPLAQTAYGQIDARESGDLDFMVLRHDLSRAAVVLKKLGYVDAVSPSAKETDACEAYNLFTKRSRAATVDLQWVMADGTFSFSLNDSRFWIRLTTIQMQGVPIKVLSPEDSLLILCVHGGKHVFEQLKWVCDIAEQVRSHPAIDWTYFEDTARSMGCWRLALAGLGLAQALLQAPLPKGIQEAIDADRAIGDLIRRIPQSLLLNPSYGLSDADAEAFLFATKDDLLGKCTQGLTLIANRHEVLSRNHSYIVGWNALQRCYASLAVPRRLLRCLLPSDASRQRVFRWLTPAA
ncbi:MAG: nucleotidyltransferase family protein [Nitrospiraceae bacterium]